jgi:hypothetical protein
MVPAIPPRNDDAFEGLQALAVAFLDLYLNHHGITGAEVRQGSAAQPRRFQLLNDVH